MYRRFDELPLDNTIATMRILLPATLEPDARVGFLCPPGEGMKIMQRIRVKISRLRNDMRKQGRKVDHFRLRTTIHPHTDGSGKRHECVIIWRHKSESLLIREMLEDLLHG